MTLRQSAAMFALLVSINAFAATEKRMHAAGQFEIKMNPQPVAPGNADARLGRFALDKQFQGDLVGRSLGEMIAHRTAVAGSAGYVAMERVDGSLHGRKGSFVLQHSGTMNRGAATLVLTVVPDSADGDLAGLAGEMAIDIKDGKHFYTFNYRLP
jgi:hypothetical protein